MKRNHKLPDTQHYDVIITPSSRTTRKQNVCITFMATTVKTPPILPSVSSWSIRPLHTNLAFSNCTTGLPKRGIILPIHQRRYF